MKRHLFALEHLEGRALFSVVAPMDVEPTMATTAVPVITQATATVLTPFPSAFNVSGHFTHPLGNPDTGSQYNFRGTGSTKTLGAFSLKGYVKPPGLIANGQASGIFIITTAHGTIRLAVVGPPQSSGALPATLNFRIVRGTGAYLNSKGKGQILLSASATTGKFLFRFKPTT